MDTKTISRAKLGQLIIRALGAGMESSFRYRFFGPAAILNGAGIRPGQTVLELGCGTGYFTLPAARLIGDQGRLFAMDVLSESTRLVSRKVHLAGLKNVCLVRGDAVRIGLNDESFDALLLFGVIPAPMLPLARLLPEVQRVLRPGGALAVWPPVPGWLPQAITRSGRFQHAGYHSGVHTFRRC